jgi:AAA+ superfamily predicted ATPase
MEPFANAIDHLLAELSRLDLMLHRQVRRLRAAHLLAEDPYRGLYIPDAQIDAILNAAPSHRVVAGSIGERTNTEAITQAIEQGRSELDARTQATQQPRLPLVEMAIRFGLSGFEMDVLLIAIAPEIDLKYETLFAYVQNDVTRKRPTVDLVLKLLGEDFEKHLAHRVHFAEDSPLFRHHLLALSSDPQERDPTLLSRFIKADQRIIDQLLGRDGLDARLVPFTRRVQCSGSLNELVLPQSLRARLQRAAASLMKQPAVFLFQGNKGIGRQSAAEAICAGLNLPLLSVEVCQALATDCAWPIALGLLRREAMLSGSALFFRDFEVLLADDAASGAQRCQFARTFRAMDVPVFLGTEHAWHPDSSQEDLPFATFVFPPPDYSERLQLWQRALDGSINSNGNRLDLDALANKFRFSAGQIHHAVRTARLGADLNLDGTSLSQSGLQAAANLESSQPLQKLARKIETVYGWDDIVLPPRALRQLREVCLSVKHRATVYGRWGFERKLSLGKGLNALFSGPSGTGKTMAAQIIGGELGLDLYQIDLSSIVSKYIGETEKNLNTIFSAAKNSNAILFFDEADALFGKRSEVKDAHDRYANIEVAYLLQKVEEYEGIVILATNLSKNIDDAFHRRLHHTVEFPFPDAEYRERIWRGAFPAKTPLAGDIEFEFLARQFELAGGNIRNIALAGAFLAAGAESQAGGPHRAKAKSVTMEHLVLATARELQKTGKLPAKTDFGEYYELIRERA